MVQLPRWVLTNRNPAFYDSESATALEQTAKLYGAMQTLIDEYNAFAEKTEKAINDFMSDANTDREVFEVAMRQEFQDFIDVVDLRLQTIENDVVAYSKKMIDEAIQSGKISVIETYNEETESLDMTVTGGV